MQNAIEAKGQLIENVLGGWRVDLARWVDQVLFASDMPFEPTPGLYVRETIRVIESLDLTPDQKDRIYRRNAERILNLTAA